MIPADQSVRCLDDCKHPDTHSLLRHTVKRAQRNRLRRCSVVLLGDLKQENICEVPMKIQGVSSQSTPLNLRERRSAF